MKSELSFFGWTIIPLKATLVWAPFLFFAHNAANVDCSKRCCFLPNGSYNRMKCRSFVEVWLWYSSPLDGDLFKRQSCVLFCLTGYFFASLLIFFRFGAPSLALKPFLSYLQVVSLCYCWGLVFVKRNLIRGGMKQTISNHNSRSQQEIHSV